MKKYKKYRITPMKIKSKICTVINKKIEIKKSFLGLGKVSILYIKFLFNRKKEYRYLFLLYPDALYLKSPYPKTRYFEDIYKERLKQCFFEISSSYPFFSTKWYFKYPFFIANYWALFSGIKGGFETRKIQGVQAGINRLSKNKKIIRIYTFENKEYEYRVISALKGLSVVNIGYLHSFPIILTDFIIDKKQQYLPDLILSSSRYMSGYMRENNCPAKIIDTYNIRQKFPRITMRYNLDTTLVLFPIDARLSKLLAEYVRRLSYEIKNHKFLVKFHPFGPKFKFIAKNIYELNSLKDGYSIAKTFLWIGLTTSALEGLCYGLTPVKYVPNSNDNIPDKFVEDISNYKILVHNIHEFKMAINKSKHLSNKKIKYFRNYLFNNDIPKSDFWKTIDKFIEKM